MSFNRNRHQSIISSCETETSSVNPSNRNRNYNKRKRIIVRQLSHCKKFSMEDKNERPVSPVTLVYSQLQRWLTPNQCDQLFPLINSAVVSNGMSDEQIAQQQQENLYNEHFMDVDEPSVATAAAAAAAASFDTRTLEEIDADAAYALQLQEEEYSRNSLVPTRSHQRRANNRKFPSVVIDSDDAVTSSDAEIAAQLQAEENRGQRQRPAASSQQNRSNRTGEPEVIPVPFSIRPTPQRPSSSGNNNRNNPDFSNFLQLFANRGRSVPGVHRHGNHGVRNLQNTTEDFGPDDYENLLELDNTEENKALTKEQINRLPTEKFRRPLKKNEEEDKCNICWDQFEPDQTIRRLTCLHFYHKDCIDTWLKKNNICPICRIPPIK